LPKPADGRRATFARQSRRRPLVAGGLKRLSLGTVTSLLDRRFPTGVRLPLRGRGDRGRGVRLDEGSLLRVNLVALGHALRRAHALEGISQHLHAKALAQDAALVVIDVLRGCPPEVEGDRALQDEHGAKRECPHDDDDHSDL